MLHLKHCWGRQANTKIWGFSQAIAFSICLVQCSEGKLLSSTNMHIAHNFNLRQCVREENSTIVLAQANVAPSIFDQIHIKDNGDEYIGEQ